MARRRARSAAAARQLDVVLFADLDDLGAQGSRGAGGAHRGLPIVGAAGDERDDLMGLVAGLVGRPGGIEDRVGELLGGEVVAALGGLPRLEHGLGGVAQIAAVVRVSGRWGRRLVGLARGRRLVGLARGRRLVGLAARAGVLPD